MIIKYLGDLDDRGIEGEVGETETNPLWPTKTVPITYGTCGEDLESGNSSSEGSSNNNSNSSEDLYDGKVCVICYDEQRNCFFVPCGHCATCYVCAQRYRSIVVKFFSEYVSVCFNLNLLRKKYSLFFYRIFNEENKTCPVCRRFIGKVRKLFAPKD
jgi:hypothetical protein